MKIAAILLLAGLLAGCRGGEWPDAVSSATWTPEKPPLAVEALKVGRGILREYIEAAGNCCEECIMAKFMYLYNGPVPDMTSMSKEQMKAIRDEWALWMAGVGTALVDTGAPMANGIAVVDDGSSRPALPISGYSIVEAVDLEGAKRLADGHPFLSDKTGKFSVEILELYPPPL